MGSIAFRSLSMMAAAVAAAGAVHIPTANPRVLVDEPYEPRRPRRAVSYPMSGTRETERRRRQIERGQLRAQNGLA